MTKSPTVQSSGASLSAAASGGVAPRSLSMRAGAPSRLSARTIVETAACPPELKRGEQSWQVLSCSSIRERCTLAATCQVGRLNNHDQV
jgi:hypothetical protein